MGQQLAALDGVRNTDQLLEKLRRGDQAASAELTAIYLIRSGRPDVGVELEPEVWIAGRHKRPDFLLSLAGEPDTYVEVTQPNLSEEEKQAQGILEGIVEAVKGIKRGFALEVFLRCVPTDTEAEMIRSRIPVFCMQDGIHREDLGDLGFLVLNQDAPGTIELRSHDGEVSRPRIGVIGAIAGPDEPHRHIVVRLAFSDERARQFLEAEARQLPKSAPGLIMVQMAHAPGGFKTWGHLLRRRLQPSLHTRVSAICLFDSALHGTEEGETWKHDTKLIVNPYATKQLPTWICEQINRHALGP